MSKIEEIFNNLIERYPVLESSKDDIYQAYKVLEECYLNGNKLLVAETVEAQQMRSILLASL